MIIRAKGTQVDAQSVRGVIKEFVDTVLPRLNSLHEAYEGKGDITRRERAKGLPNNRLVHAFPRYIVTMASGYLAGSPVQYAAQDEGVLDNLLSAYSACDVDSVDAELAMQASIYGRSLCICYADENARPRTQTIDPRAGFVVYDDTVEHKALFGVYWHEVCKADGTKAGICAHVYDEGNTYTYAGESIGALTDTGESKPHFFGGVPLIEFWNTADERGDFENVLSLINAYDILESDRVNDKEQFTDAILLLTGVTMENDAGEGGGKDLRSPGQKLREEKTLSLPDSDAKAEWLIKQSDEGGNEILRNAIKSDIHKMSMVPDLTDENFASNASGVAMRYKLFGLEQLTKNKERWFRQGLRERLSRFAAFLSKKGGAALDIAQVTITFTRSLPVNDLEIAQMVGTLQGIVPDQILLTQLPFVEDAQAALEQLTVQKQEAMKLQTVAFGGGYDDANEEEKGEEEGRETP